MLLSTKAHEHRRRRHPSLIFELVGIYWHQYTTMEFIILAHHVIHLFRDIRSQRNQSVEVEFSESMMVHDSQSATANSRCQFTNIENKSTANNDIRCGYF